jgi:hypothetical protein
LHFEAIQEDDWAALCAGPNFARSWSQLTSLHLHSIGPLRCPSLSETFSSFLEAHSCLANLHIESWCDHLDSAVFERLSPGSLPHLNSLALQLVALRGALAFLRPRPQLLDVRLLSTWNQGAGDIDANTEQGIEDDEQLHELVRLLGHQTQLRSLSLFLVLTVTTLLLLAPLAMTCPLITSLRFEDGTANDSDGSPIQDPLLLVSLTERVTNIC